MRMSLSEYLEYEAKLKAAKLEAVEESESSLHRKIIEHCDAQWPRWKYIRARMDKRSTIGVGVHDFTIFLPGGRVICVECKRKGGKPTTEQKAWAVELSTLGTQVHFVWSFDEFLKVVNE